MLLSDLLEEHFNQDQLLKLNLKVDLIDKKVGYLLWSLTKDNQHLGAEKDDYTFAVWQAVKKFSEVFDVNVNKNSSAYLYKVIERKVLDYHRHLKTQKFSALNDGLWYTNNYSKINIRESENVVDVLTENFAAHNYEEEQFVEEVYYIEKEIIKTIKDNKKYAIIEKWMEGFSYVEISNILKIPVREVNHSVNEFKIKIKKQCEL